MKKTILATMAITAAIAFNPSPLLAHDDHDHGTPPATNTPPAKVIEKPKPADGHGHSHATKIPETAEGVWQLIRKQETKLVETVEAKKLASAHDFAFSIRDLVKALPGKVSADKKPAAEEGAKEVAKLATDIDKSSAAGAQKATEANVKKLQASLNALEGKLKSVDAKK